MSTPQDVTGIPQPKEELKRPCTGRTCSGVMTGERKYYMDWKKRIEYVLWCCGTCGKVER